MNVLQFFTREEPIAGLALHEEAIRLVFLQQDQKTKNVRILAKEEEVLDRGIIINGVVKDPELLTQALKRLLAKTKFNLKYFIVSIPGDQVYYKVFTFPKSVTDEKILEAMDIAVSFQLPFAKDSAYIDWEKGASTEEDHKEVSVALSALRKEIADDYITALKKAGIKTIALEIHPFSDLRLADTSTDAILVTEESRSSTLLSVVQGGMIRFLRTLPQAFVGKNSIEKEITNLQNFYESTEGPIAAVRRSDELSWRKEFLTYSAEIEDRRIWMSALGAAERAIAPRSKDTFLSMMPLGTEKAYEYQRAAAFSNLITNVSVGLSFFFVMSFFASYALMTMIQGNFSEQVSGLGAMDTPIDATSMEERILRVDTLIAKTAAVTNKLPRWSGFIAELTEKTQGEVTINNISIPSPEGRISISGTAKDRTSLNQLRNTLRNWTTITSLEFPITNLEQRTDIPFQATFMLSDPQSIYNWK